MLNYLRRTPIQFIIFEKATPFSQNYPPKEVCFSEKIRIFVRICIFIFVEHCFNLKKMDKNKLIEIIVEAIQDKKGKDIVSLDLDGFDGAICSNFVVCNADSPTQVAAIADSIEEKVYVELGENPWRVEGKQTGLWVAVDFIDVVVHVFTTDLRDYYRLEELWADAPMTRYEYEL